jgi:hypothetical protein
VGANVRASRWLVLCTRVRTCKDVPPVLGGGGLIVYRVLLDDVLSAVDSQVARHVFGMSPSKFAVQTDVTNAAHTQIKL